MYALFLNLLSIDSIFNELNSVLMLNVLCSSFYNACETFFNFISS